MSIFLIGENFKQNILPFIIVIIYKTDFFIPSVREQRKNGPRNGIRGRWGAVRLSE